MLDTHARKYFQPIIEKAADVCLRAGLSANQVTVASLIVGLCAAGSLLWGLPWMAVALLWVSGYLDAIDGTMARKTKTTAFGTVLDVVFDRIVEIAVIIVLAWIYPQTLLLMLLLACAIIISMTVFLTVGAVSQRQSDKTFYYQAGIAERSEGFVFFTLMILLPQFVKGLIIIFALMIIITAGQRLFEARQLK